MPKVETERETHPAPANEEPKPVPEKALEKKKK